MLDLDRNRNDCAGNSSVLARRLFHGFMNQIDMNRKHQKCCKGEENDANEYPYTTDKSVTDLSQTYTEQICNMSVTDLYLKLSQSCYTYVTYLLHVCYR